MHDPLVVAFEIRRPWPKRAKYADARPGKARWNLRGPHWTVAGRGWYWPSVITVWHREPGGHDSGEVCKHYVRMQDDAGQWSMTVLHGWRFHVHHWRIQISPLQALRRQLLTRCAWCGGRQRKGDPINISHQWDGPRGRWWRGEPGLFHQDCSSVERAHRVCVCEWPVLTDNWDQCARCNKGRFGRDDAQAGRDRILAAVPDGQRDRAAYDRVCAMYQAESAAT